jgi:hypothetical protein
MKHADQVFRYVQQNVLWHTSHMIKHCRGLYYCSSKISQESLAFRPCVHNTVDTKYVILCSVSFIYEHSLLKYVTSLSLALKLHICRFIKQAVHCEMEVLRISCDIPFSLRRPQTSPKQTNETYLIRKLEIPYINIDCRYFRPSITKIYKL